MRAAALALALAAIGCGGGGGGDGTPDAAPQGGSCTGVNAPGNAKKVGEYCTRQGGQCADNGVGNATICAIDFDPDPTSTATFCTKACFDELSCGPDSICIGDRPTSTTKGCVPVSCKPDWYGDAGLPDSGP